jgi:hypothetical protein
MYFTTSSIVLRSLLDYRKLFSTLNHVDDAKYDSLARESESKCLEGTRTKVLTDICHWFYHGETLLYWLSGVAGTGKSTIANSVAEYFDNLDLLGASFFFSRDQQSRRETRFLFQTIAFQLGSTYPALKVEISKALEDQGLIKSRLSKQFQKLVLLPISRLGHIFRSPILVVLDALDECEENDSVVQIIQLFINGLHGRSVPLRVFVTSRPEYHLRSLFLRPEVSPETCPFVLHEIDRSEVRQDIMRYVEHELTDISRTHREILDGDLWPKQSDIESLVDMASGLFIAASTALKFIHPDSRVRDPRPRLIAVLDACTPTSNVLSQNPFKHLDSVYNRILAQALTENQSPNVLQTVLAAVILGFDRLSIRDWDRLLQTEGAAHIVLADLHSVILISAGDGVIHAFHPSFHDYLIDENRCTIPGLFINPDLHHIKMVQFCLERMISSLKRDICEIGNYFIPNNQVDDLDERKKRYLPGDLQYACQYWTLHLQNSCATETLIDLIQNFLFTSLFHWVEVLGLLGELTRGIESVAAVHNALLVCFKYI